MRAFILTAALFLLLPFAPARAYTTNALFKCSRDEFTLLRTDTGFMLYGAVNTLYPGSTYTVSPVTGRGDGNGETTVTIAPPQPSAATRRRDILRLGSAVPSEAWPVSRLTVHFDDPTGFAPVDVTCYQIAGSQ